MARGVAYVLLACLLWGAIFVVPRYMGAFDSLEVATGRYLFYGLISLLFLAFDRKLIGRIDRTLWLKAFWLGLGGNLFYYFLLVVCIRYSGATISALMLGIAPITIAWYGNWQKKESRFRNLILPSLATAVGLILVNLPSLERSAIEGSLGRYFLGLAAGFAALGLWTWYALAGKMVMHNYPTVSASDWSTALGTATFISVLLMLGGLFLFGNMRWNGEMPAFLIGSAILGILCSWIGFYLWSKGSSLIPSALAGQLLISETLFGLCFVHCLDQRLPETLEWLGMLFMLFGILASMREAKKAIPAGEHAA